ncbi:hypothetical protein IFR05_014800 [Cadophora sp. M221]|nr:hypothetical protein IFR05_014800 [Cadophora sp. M221]
MRTYVLSYVSTSMQDFDTTYSSASNAQSSLTIALKSQKMETFPAATEEQS